MKGHQVQQTNTTGMTIEDHAHIIVLRLYSAGSRDRDSIVKETVCELVQKHSCTYLNSCLHAARAVANHEAKDTRARVDVAKCTTNCVFVNINGELRALSVLDLERALAANG